MIYVCVHCSDASCIAKPSNATWIALPYIIYQKICDHQNRAFPKAWKDGKSPPPFHTFELWLQSRHFVRVVSCKEIWIHTIVHLAFDEFLYSEANTLTDTHELAFCAPCYHEITSFEPNYIECIITHVVINNFQGKKSVRLPRAGKKLIANAFEAMYTQPNF